MDGVNAHGRTAYDQAKSEGKTKLNYQQWVQVRTPAFKEWFWEWENGQREEQQPRQTNAERVVGDFPRANTGAANETQSLRRSDSGVRGLDRQHGVASTTALRQEWKLDPKTGEPRLFYHGTKNEFTVFDLDSELLTTSN